MDLFLNNDVPQSMWLLQSKPVTIRLVTQAFLAGGQLAKTFSFGAGRGKRAK